MQRGTLVRWFEEKGYGFIRPETEGDDVFLHVKALRHWQRQPKEDDIILYDTQTDEKGKRRAVGAKIEGLAFSTFTIFGILAVLGLAGYVYLVFTQNVPLYPVAVAYAGMSLLTIWVYSKDKGAARAGAWRTSEAKLHLLELLDGWPGAFLAQRFYRHKNQKLSYQMTFWLIVILHGVVWYQVLAPVEWAIPYLPSGNKITQVIGPLKNLSNHYEQGQARPQTSSAQSQQGRAQIGQTSARCPEYDGNTKVFTGTIISVKPQTGMLIRFNSTSEGRIPSSDLPINFPKLYSKGDLICVSIKQVSIRENKKQYELALME